MLATIVSERPSFSFLFRLSLAPLYSPGLSLSFLFSLFPLLVLLISLRSGLARMSVD